MAEPAGQRRGLWLHVARENVIPGAMNEVSVTVAQLLFCVCLSGSSHVGRRPACDWENQCFSFLYTFAAQEQGNRKTYKKKIKIKGRLLLGKKPL